MFRKKLSGKKNRRNFKRGNRVNKRNFVGVTRRGGIRL